MAVRVAINGFGRIGRHFYRALYERNMLNDMVEIVAVNDPGDAENLAYLLKYDSVHGKMNDTVKALDENTIQVGQRVLKTLQKKVTPKELPWRDLNIDIVVECTGLFEKGPDAHGHIESGAKRVIISAPSDENTGTFLMGVNHDKYNNEEVISNGSCTTNGEAPMVHVLMNSGIGIDEGIMSTIHAYTATQSLVDGVSSKDLRRGRAAALNVVPSSTGASKSVIQAIPELKGKLEGMSYRVPVADVSVLELTFRTSRDTSLEEINGKMKEASETYLKGILGYTEEPVVSSDFIHDTRSSVYDATASIGLNSRFFKLVTWYDNEWGYCNRLVDMVEVVAKNLTINS